MAYWIAEKPTPLFNRADLHYLFGMEDGKSLPLDASGLFRPLEMIAFPGTIFETIEVHLPEEKIIKVKTDSYPHPVYVDQRCLKALHSKDIKLYDYPLASICDLQQSLMDKVGLPYLWGGNISNGVDSFYSLYPPQSPISPELERIWKLQGLDCSGLLFEVTHGKTPRNTSELLHFGKKILNPSEQAFYFNFGTSHLFSSPMRSIHQFLLPLDLLVWKGHVVIVLDENRAIESNASLGGVVVLDLKQRLQQILDDRKVHLHNDGYRFDFSIRRWIR